VLRQRVAPVGLAPPAVAALPRSALRCALLSARAAPERDARAPHAVERGAASRNEPLELGDLGRQLRRPVPDPQRRLVVRDRSRELPCRRAAPPASRDQRMAIRRRAGASPAKGGMGPAGAGGPRAGGRTLPLALAGLDHRHIEGRAPLPPRLHRRRHGRGCPRAPAWREECSVLACARASGRRCWHVLGAALFSPVDVRPWRRLCGWRRRATALAHAVSRFVGVQSPGLIVVFFCRLCVILHHGPKVRFVLPGFLRSLVQGDFLFILYFNDLLCLLHLAVVDDYHLLLIIIIFIVFTTFVLALGVCCFTIRNEISDGCLFLVRRISCQPGAGLSPKGVEDSISSLKDESRRCCENPARVRIPRSYTRVGRERSSEKSSSRPSMSPAPAIPRIGVGPSGVQINV